MAPEPEAARPGRAGANRSGAVSFRMVFAILLGAVTAFSLLQSLVIPVLPTIQRGLHTSQRNVTWVLTAYLLSAAVCTPILGRVGDAYGKERMLVVALAGLSVGCVAAALASSLLVMIVARLVQGVGGAVLPLSFGILRDKAPTDRVAGSIGVVAAMTAVGGGFAIVLAGPVVRALDYHWLFWLPLPDRPVRPGRQGLAPWRAAAAPGSPERMGRSGLVRMAYLSAARHQ